MFTHIDKLISSVSRHSKTGEVMLALSVRRAFRDVLLKTADLPREVTESAKAVSFKNGTLTIQAQGLARAELLMRAGALMRDINKVLGRRAVWKIKFR